MVQHLAISTRRCAAASHSMNNNRTQLASIIAPAEWDFRGITPQECSQACVWEYARSSPYLCSRPEEWLCGVGAVTEVEHCIESAGFPRAWSQLDAQLRAELSRVLVTRQEPLKVRSMREFVAEYRGVRSAQAGVVLDLIGRRDGYVINLNFRAGIKSVQAALNKWVSTVARDAEGRRRRGKGAERPWAALKRLAAFRIENSRASRSFETIQAMLQDAKSKATDTYDVLPLYDSHGAWSKAKGEAAKLLELCEINPDLFAVKLGCR